MRNINILCGGRVLPSFHELICIVSYRSILDKKQVIIMKELLEELDKAVNVIKIEITSEEKEELAVELSIFLEWLEPLLAIDTGDVDQVLIGHGAVNVLRDDKVQSGELDELQKAASNFDQGFYQVPPVIE
jgi:aspartyl/glutamyl-tRNA(Asn/Gln) amidotransferase C subunit